MLRVEAPLSNPQSQIPRLTRLGLLENGQIRLQHGIVDDFLLVGKFSTDWERGGDIRRVAIVLRSHVEEAHVAVFDLLLVGSVGVAVMQDGAVFSTGSNARIGQMTATAVIVGNVTEQTEKNT